jgi:hypothetical protein
MQRKKQDENLSKKIGAVLDSADEPPRSFTKAAFESALKKASRKIEPKKSR